MKQVSITFFALTIGLLLSSGLLAQDMDLHSSSPAAVKELRTGLKALGHDWTFTMQQVEKALELDDDLLMANIFAAFDAYTNEDEAGIETYLAKIKAYKGEIGEAEQIYLTFLEKGGDKDFDGSPLGQKLSDTYPNDALAQLMAGMIFVRNGKGELSTPFFEKSLSLESIPSAHNMVAYGYMRSGDMETAKAHFDKYMKAAPNHANPYDSMGDYYMAAEDYAEAAAYYEKAYATDNSFTISKEKAAAAREKMGEK